MVWTETTRRHYERKGMRYASDTTDKEWALIEKFFPQKNRIGRPRKNIMREIWNAIQYIVTTGCQWRFLPKNFPPFTSVQYYFYQFRDNGILDIVNETLVMAARILAGRDAMPTAAIIDSQSVKTTESGGVRGYDAGKKTKGRKRHIMTDTQGNMLGVQAHTASLQDRDEGPAVVRDVTESFPTIKDLLADGGYQGPKMENALREMDGPALHIIKRSDQQKGFVVLPWRWVVERTFAWLNRSRRLSKDWETSIASSEAWILVASIRRQSRFISKRHSF